MKKALVVDDSRAIRTMLSRILVRYGFEVAQAGDGSEALVVLEQHHGDFDLLCVDYNMPVMNGLELLSEMREQPRFDVIPNVMATTETQIDFITSALALGANEYVMKPFTDVMVLEKLQTLGLVPYE